MQIQGKTSEIIENMDKHRSLKLKSTNPGNRNFSVLSFGMPEHGKVREQYCRGVNSYMHNSTYNNSHGAVHFNKWWYEDKASGNKRKWLYFKTSREKRALPADNIGICV